MYFPIKVMEGCVDNRMKVHLQFPGKGKKIWNFQAFILEAEYADKGRNFSADN
jgi:hypothetical protein